jgi:hypothetical protein
MVDLVTNTNKEKSLVMPRENRLRSLSLMCLMWNFSFFFF